MVKIREGMFETNSSSTHTIVVTDNRVPARPGLCVDFAIGEFGWEFSEIKDINEKASYLYTMACAMMHKDVYQRFYEMLTKYGIECSCSCPAEFEDNGGWKWLANGYVDHHSDGDARSFVDRMMNHEHALIKFLFSEESFVLTGNDNCNEEEAEFFDKANVNYPHQTYEKGN